MAAAATNAANGAALTEVLTQQLKVMLEAGNYDAVKPLLQPVQEVDIAEAIGGLPRTLQALAFRLLSKDEAIEVYEYLEASVQQTLLERLRSSEVLELVEEMSPDDRVHLFDELPAKVVRRLLAELSPAERRVTAQLLGYEPETGPGPGDHSPPRPRHRNHLRPLRHRRVAPPHRHLVAARPGGGRPRRPRG